MKKNIAYILIFIIILQLTVVNVKNNVHANEPENLFAKAALLMDAENGRVLFEKNGYEQMPMASTTKIMTCIYVIENSNLEDIVTISKKAASQPKVHLGAREGEKYKLKDLLYALMLESYNDTAVAIAEHVSGTVEQFCMEMTNKAKDIGAYNTSFRTPNGLDADEHYTTAYDLAMIAKYAITNQTFLEIINQKEYSFQEITKKRSFTISNKDAFLHLYEGAIGIKTGFTGKAGYCFVGAVKRDERTFISVVLGSGWPPNKSYKWKDTTKLMNFGVNEFNKKQLIDKNMNFDPIIVEDGITPVIQPYIDEDYSMLVGENEKITILVDLPDKLNAPIKLNQRIGALKLYVDDKQLRSIDIKAQEESRRINYPYILYEIVDKFLLK